MAVYYKFKSAKDYDSIPIDGHFITVALLKEKIYESKQLGRGTDYDLVVTNAQTNEEYLDEDMLIPKNTSVLIRRIPGLPRKPIVATLVIGQPEPKAVNEPESGQQAKSNFSEVGLSATNYLDGSEYDEFGSDLYEIPEVVPLTSNIQVHEAPVPSKADEDSKIQALIDTPALDWQQQNFDGFGAGRGFGHGSGGRLGARGFGRGTPPLGYVCHRCKTPGHLIQHCPTNGDPNFDIKRVKPPTGIPKSMLMATPDGSYTLPSGAAAVLKPNQAAFEREMEGMPSTRNVGDLPPELHCSLCKQVMKDAVLTSKCCFKSFCDKCIRDHIIDKLVCVCGATNVLADDLLPNKTLRDTINRILESNNSSGENGGSAYHVQYMESAKCAPPPPPQPKIPSPAPSATSKEEQPAPAPPQNGDNTKIQPGPAEHDAAPVTQQTASQGNDRPVDDEAQQKQVANEAVTKKKKKVSMPIGAADIQWREYAPENYMMPPGPNPYNPYWNGMQPGMDVFMGPGPYGGARMPYMGCYGPGPMNVPFGVMFPQDPFGVPGGFMMPPFIPPQRDLAEMVMGKNGGGGPPVMSREEFEAQRAELTLKQKRDFEKREWELGRETRGNEDGLPMKSKTKPIPPPSGGGHRHRTERLSPDHRRSRDDDHGTPLRPSSRRKSSRDWYDYDDSYYASPHHHHRHSQHDRTHRRSESSSARRSPSSDPKPTSASDRNSQQDKSRSRSESSSTRRPLSSDPKPPAAAADRSSQQDRSHRPAESSSARRPPSSDPKPASATEATSTNDQKHKTNVFSHISFTEEEEAAASKKRRCKSSSSEAASGGRSVALPKESSTTATVTADMDTESSDDERHFKRRSSRDRDREHRS